MVVSVGKSPFNSPYPASKLHEIVVIGAECTYIQSGISRSRAKRLYIMFIHPFMSTAFLGRNERNKLLGEIQIYRTFPLKTIKPAGETHEIWMYRLVSRHETIKSTGKLRVINVQNCDIRGFRRGCFGIKNYQRTRSVVEAPPVARRIRC